MTYGHSDSTRHTDAMVIQTIRVTHMPYGHSGSDRHTDAMVIQMPRSLICPTVIQTLPGTHMLPGMLMTKVHTEHRQAL